jgi:hypothetical protein
MVNIIHMAGPAGSHTSQSDSPQVTRFLIRPDFLYNYFVTQEDNNTIVSISGVLVIASKNIWLLPFFYYFNGFETSIKFAFLVPLWTTKNC